MSLQQDQLDRSTDDSTQSTSDNAARKTSADIPKRRLGWIRFIVIGTLVITVILGVAGAVLVQVQKSVQNKAAAEAGDLSGPKIVVPNKDKQSTDASINTDKAPNETKNASSNKVDDVAAAAHPIEPALKKAREVLEFSTANIQDYMATIIKRERKPDGKTGQEEIMFVKIRNRKVDEDGNVEVPFAVYIKYLTPKSIAGREVIWEENANNGKLIAHEPGIFNLFRFPLNPEGPIAMRGQRYPIWEIGMENLAVQLIKRGEKELEHPECDVQFIEGATIGDRTCTLIQVLHEDKKPEYDFHKAVIFIDDEWNVPLRYAAYFWPEVAGAEPPVDEEYTYKDVKLNVGLTDVDFDPDNPEYNYP